MPAALIGRKLGMTRYFMEGGRNVPVTVIEAGPCAVTQVKTSARHKYVAVQLAFGDVKPRRSTMPVIGHDAKAGQPPRRWHREMRVESDGAAEAYQVGQQIDVSIFAAVPYVDVTATSKGKGFQGVMKRHNFKGLCASHGTERKHRSAGAIASHATNRGRGPKPKSGKRMAGHMGAARVTTRNLDVIAVDPERHLLLVKGPVPGPRHGMLFIREACRLSRRKGRIAREKAKA